MSADRSPETAHSGRGSFWTQAEWAEWSNTLAECLPEEYDGDAAQEALIERALMDLATVARDVATVLDEYEAAGITPAPYTSERTLYERLSHALGREPQGLTSPPGPVGRPEVQEPPC